MRVEDVRVSVVMFIKMDSAWKTKWVSELLALQLSSELDSDMIHLTEEADYGGFSLDLSRSLFITQSHWDVLSAHRYCRSVRNV